MMFFISWLLPFSGFSCFQDLHVFGAFDNLYYRKNSPSLRGIFRGLNFVVSIRVEKFVGLIPGGWLSPVSVAITFSARVALDSLLMPNNFCAWELMFPSQSPHPLLNVTLFD